MKNSQEKPQQGQEPQYEHKHYKFNPADKLLARPIRLLEDIESNTSDDKALAGTVGVIKYDVNDINLGIQIAGGFWHLSADQYQILSDESLLSLRDMALNRFSKFWGGRVDSEIRVNPDYCWCCAKKPVDIAMFIYGNKAFSILVCIKHLAEYDGAFLTEFPEQYRVSS